MSATRSRDTMEELLVSAQWLSTHLDDPNLCILDATYHMPAAQRDADAEFLTRHIPHAQRFDIDRIKDEETDLPHMLPSAEDFERAAITLGITTHSHIVIYDTYGCFSAPRAWWMFRVFGHTNVSVLNGGLPAWTAIAAPCATGSAAARPHGNFQAEFHQELVIPHAAMVDATTHSTQILDARSGERFRGEVPEPRAGLRSGHIPKSINIPLSSLLQPDGMMKSVSELQALFKQHALDLQQPIITTCGSGVTACGLAFALTLLGAQQVAVYDGSWAEWGIEGKGPVAIGKA